MDSCQLGNRKYVDEEAKGKWLHKKNSVDCILLCLLHNTASPAGVLHGSVHRLTCITRGSLLVMQAASVSHEYNVYGSKEEENKNLPICWMPCSNILTMFFQILYKLCSNLT